MSRSKDFISKYESRNDKISKVLFGTTDKEINSKSVKADKIIKAISISISTIASTADKIQKNMKSKNFNSVKSDFESIIKIGQSTLKDFK